MQRNRFLIIRLLESDDNSERNASQLPTNPDRFYVIPDFHNIIPNFLATDSKIKARDWLQFVQAVAQLVHWTEAFKLEIIGTKLVAAASN